MRNRATFVQHIVKIMAISNRTISYSHSILPKPHKKPHSYTLEIIQNSKLMGRKCVENGFHKTVTPPVLHDRKLVFILTQFTSWDNWKFCILTSYRR